jgi:TonB-linked SusC/RagA family outer membrane protein
MKKNYCFVWEWNIPKSKKLLRTMKLTISLLLISVISVMANSTYSQTKALNLNMGKTTVKKVLSEIEDQSEFYFMYSEKIIDVNREVDVNVDGEKIEPVLNTLFAGTDVNHKIEDRIIVLTTPAVYKNTAQQQAVSGNVTDEFGQSLPGVTVIIKGTMQGTVTGVDGNYSITNIPENATLIFSFVGMEAQEIVVGNQTSINVTLITDAIGLEEIVAVGYGTARRKDISGAVSTVRLEDSPIALSPNTSILQSLKGGVAGVNIGVQNSPGGTPEILVRGQNSINGSNQPLIVMDGIIYLGSINDINPDDIAVLDVLKDASAAAVYGSRASNGVIVISTKKGKSEKPIISYNTSIGINTWQNKFDMMNRERWTQKYIAQTPSISTPGEIVHDASYATTLWEQSGVDTDWLDLVSRSGYTQNHQVAVSGRSNRINYYFSGGYSDHEGVIIGDDYQRISVRSRLDADITDWLEVGIDGAYNNNDYSGIRAGLGVGLYQSHPWAYPYRYEGAPVNPSSNTGTLLERYPTGQSVSNPLWGTDGTIEDIDKRNFFRLATYALFRVPKVDGLTYRFNYSINSNINIQDQFRYEDYYVGEATTAPYYDRYSPSELAKRLSQANGYNRRRNTRTYVMDHIINYKKEFGDHYVDATAVATRDYSYRKYVDTNGSDYSLNGNTLLGVDGIHKAAVQKVDLNVVEKANIGYLGRLGYAFKDKYHLSASMRRDGASVFGKDQKWGNFPSVGVAWTATEEDFTSSFENLSYLKIKASYGKNGNQGLDPYQTLAGVASGGDGGIRYEFADAPSTILYGVAQSNLGSPSLGWETTTSFNGGFQSAWLNNRVFLDLDFYFSKTTDQIFERQIPIMTGFGSIYSSLGQVDNKGLEISLHTINVSKKDLKWSSSLIFWQNRNKVVELYGDDADGDGVEDDDLSNNLFIGKSLGAIYGYEYIGVVQEDDTEYIENTGVAPGDAMFRDISGPEGIADGIISADYDRRILGYRKENFRLSLSNTVEYKNLSLYVMLTGIFGGGKDNYFLSPNPRYNSFRDRYGTNEIDHDWWTPENKSEYYLRADSYSNRYLGLQSRGFVRVQDINLSYKLPKGTLSSIGVNSLELYTSIKNLYTFTNWFGGGDPEFEKDGISGITPESNTPPVPSVYSMGLKVSF